MPKTCYTHLSPEERATLSLGLAQGQSLRMIARVLGRAPSTLSRECTRNMPRGQPYRTSTAQTQAVAGHANHAVPGKSTVPGYGRMSSAISTQAAHRSRLRVGCVAGILMT